MNIEYQAHDPFVYTTEPREKAQQTQHYLYPLPSYDVPGVIGHTSPVVVYARFARQQKGDEQDSYCGNAFELRDDHLSIGIDESYWPYTIEQIPLSTDNGRLVWDTTCGFKTYSAICAANYRLVGCLSAGIYPECSIDLFSSSDETTFDLYDRNDRAALRLSRKDSQELLRMLYNVGDPATNLDLEHINAAISKDWESAVRVVGKDPVSPIMDLYAYTNADSPRINGSPRLAFCCSLMAFANRLRNSFVSIPIRPERRNLADRSAAAAPIVDDMQGAQNPAYPDVNGQKVAEGVTGYRLGSSRQHAMVVLETQREDAETSYAEEEAILAETEALLAQLEEIKSRRRYDEAPSMSTLAEPAETTSEPSFSDSGQYESPYIAGMSYSTNDSAKDDAVSEGGGDALSDRDREMLGRFLRSTDDSVSGQQHPENLPVEMGAASVDISAGYNGEDIVESLAAEFELEDWIEPAQDADDNGVSTPEYDDYGSRPLNASRVVPDTPAVQQPTTIDARDDDTETPEIEPASDMTPQIESEGHGALDGPVETINHIKTLIIEKFPESILSETHFGQVVVRADEFSITCEMRPTFLEGMTIQSVRGLDLDTQESISPDAKYALRLLNDWIAALDTMSMQEFLDTARQSLR